MSNRWGKPIKNKRRIDPRYFLNERGYGEYYDDDDSEEELVISEEIEWDDPLAKKSQHQPCCYMKFRIPSLEDKDIMKNVKKDEDGEKWLSETGAWEVANHHEVDKEIQEKIVAMMEDLEDIRSQY